MRVGITGHQRLRDPGLWPWVEGTIEDQLRGLTPPLTAVTSLAIGADQLLARVVERLGGDIYAVIPFDGYDRTFQPTDLADYKSLLSKAGWVEVLCSPGSDEDAFLAAGQRVVQLAEVVLAVWDGAPAKGRGGTADIVLFAQRCGVPLVHINPAQRSVTWPLNFRP